MIDYTCSLDIAKLVCGQKQVPRLFHVESVVFDDFTRENYVFCIKFEVKSMKLIKVFWAKNKLKLCTMQALCMKCSMYVSIKLVWLRLRNSLLTQYF